MINNLRSPASIKNFSSRSNSSATYITTPLILTGNVISSNVATGTLRVQGGVGVTGNVTANIVTAVSGIYGTVMTPNQPQITGVGFQANLQAKDLTVTGNLVLLGTPTTVSSINTTVSDSLFEIHTGAGGATLTVDDGQDLGLILNYYKSGSARKAFLGWDNQTGELRFLTNASVGSGQVTGDLGALAVGTISVAANIASTSQVTGALVVTGGVGVGGSVYAGAIYTDTLFYANGDPFTGVIGASGAQGPIGATGIAGATGPQGVVGPTGVPGATGIQGPPGSGATGATGAAGTPGLAGGIGATGASGAQGQQGPAGATGQTGNQGPVGPQGATGASGFTGPQGAAGATGSTGPEGPAGDRGAAGSTGATGPQGIQGITGQVGATGLTGNQGPAGATGFGATGATGVQGPPGTPGTPNGATGATGEQGPPGPAGIGLTGPQGDQGPVGATGPLGPQGDQGPVGATGPLGPQGVQGDQGAPGATGPAGPAGALGPAGSTGATGTPGLDGAPGITGATGLTGNQGDRGPPGATGATGADGATGPSGPQGPTGATGQQGTPGDPGGATGPQGIPGLQGATGATGSSGPPGPQGIPGTAAYQGATGATGIQGIRGLLGPAGATGATGLGATGATGSQGPAGDPGGATGATGVQGATGIGATGATGAQGLAGTPGVNGATGATGPAGFSVSAFPFKVNSVVRSGHPANGYLLYNTATQIAANVINIDHLTSDDVDVDIFLGLLSKSEIITIQDKSSSQNYQRFTITNTPVNFNPLSNNSYWSIPVTIQSSLGTGTTNFTNNTDVIIGLVSGVSGATGATGAQGPAGSPGGATGATGVQGATGIGATGATGLTGPQGPIGGIGLPGATGSTGPQGIPGSPGGATGPQGATGALGATGATGVRGLQGAPGSTGATGPQGATGLTGGFGGVVTQFLFSTSIVGGDPTSGRVAFNNTFLDIATAMYIDDEAQGAVDIQIYLRGISDSTSTIKGHFKISNRYDETQFSMFVINSVTENSGYFTINCTNVGGSVIQFANNTPVVVTFARTGDKGDTGATGISITSANIVAGNLTVTFSSNITTNIGDVRGATGATGPQGDPGGATGATGIIGGVIHNVTNSGAGSYTINGQSNPLLYLIRGYTYYFNLSAPGHPFWIKTDQSTGTANAYSTGVTNNGIDSGLITFTVPHDAPNTLYYNCQYHSPMRGTFVVNTFGLTGATGPIGATGPQGPLGSTGATGVQGATGQRGATGVTSVTVRSIFTNNNAVKVNVPGVSVIEFDDDSGFDVENRGSGNVRIAMNSTFKYWEVAGSDQLVATGLDHITINSGNGIVITSNASDAPYQSITFSTVDNPIIVANVVPVGQKTGDMWFDSDDGILSIYLGNSWIQVGSTNWTF